jgi:hypothetical protein
VIEIEMHPRAGKALDFSVPGLHCSHKRDGLVLQAFLGVETIEDAANLREILHATVDVQTE